MRSYKKKGLLLVFIINIFILTILFFYLINTVKLWTYNTVSILNANDNVITIFTTLDIEIVEDNNFFYYDTLKYTYKIKSRERLEDGVILNLELDEVLNLVIEDKEIFLPNKKMTILSLIIESWRVK